MSKLCISIPFMDYLDICSKMDDTMEEEEMFASPYTVCAECPVLEKKIIFYQKKISWLRRSKSKLEDSNQRKLYVIKRRSHYPTRCTTLMLCI